LKASVPMLVHKLPISADTQVALYCLVDTGYNIPLLPTLSIFTVVPSLSNNLQKKPLTVGNTFLVPTYTSEIELSPRYTSDIFLFILHTIIINRYKF
jgi:hypothetical protein